MKTGKSIANGLMIAALAGGLGAFSATADIIFTEDFESPVGDGNAAQIHAGTTNFDNQVTAGMSSGSFAGRMQQTENGTNPHSGNQFYEMNGGSTLDSSILFQVAAANTLANGTTLTVSLWSASIFNDTVDETFDVIVSGGAVGTQSDTADSAPGVWQQHTFYFTVTDATQAINLKVLATRGSTTSEDLAIDLITVTEIVGALSLSTPSVSSIDTNRATLGAVVDAGTSVLTWGTVWDTTPTPAANSSTVGGATADAPIVFSHERTGMQPGTHYYSRGWASNAADGLVYTETDADFYTEPMPASSVTFSSIGDNAMQIDWTKPASATGSLVVVRADRAVAATPADGATYTASAMFGSGFDMGAGSLEYVVYTNSGTSVTVTGLAAGTLYHVAVYSYAGPNALINYQLDTPATGLSLTTGDVPSLKNGDFQLPDVSANAATDVYPTSWTTTGGSATRLGDGNIGGVHTTPEQFLYFNSGTATVGGTAYQTFTTVPGTAYTVSFQVSKLFGGAGYAIVKGEAFDGVVTSGTALGTVTGTQTTQGEGAPVEFTFTADSAITTLVFTDESTDAAGIDTGLDNVTITGIVPVGTVICIR